MRQYVPYTILAALIGVFVFRATPPSQAPPALASMYDSTVAMIKDFAAGDDSLGFANKKEIEQVWIDTSNGLSMQYLAEDSLFTLDTLLMNFLPSMHRIMYPIYTNANGQRKLVGAVTFDSVGNPHPITIDDSSTIRPFLNFEAKHHLKHGRFTIVRAPFLHDYFVLARSDNANFVVGSTSLRMALGSDYPSEDSGTAADGEALNTSTFISAMRRYQQSSHLSDSLR